MAQSGGGPFSAEFSAPFQNAVITQNTWAGVGIDTVSVPPGVYREADAIADPLAPQAITPVDPLLGLAAFGAQLGEFAALLQTVLAELQARGDRIRSN
jgi:hypothetical protein